MGSLPEKKWETGSECGRNHEEPSILWPLTYEPWLSVECSVHVRDNRDGHLRGLENISSTSHKASFSEAILIPTATCIVNVFTLIIRCIYKPQTEIWLIRRNTRIQPISVPGNSHRHVHDISCDCGRWLSQSDCGQLFLRKVGHGLEIGFQLPNIPRIKAPMGR